MCLNMNVFVNNEIWLFMKTTIIEISEENFKCRITTT